MKRTNIFYFLKEGFQNVFLHSVSSTTSLGILIACLLIVGTFFLVEQNFTKMINSIGAKNEIDVFINDHFSTEQAIEIGPKIEALEGVESAVFISSEEGLQNFISKYAQYQDIADSLAEDNPLPDSFKVTVEKMEATSEIAEKIKGIVGVAKVKLSSDLISNFLNVQNVVTAVGITLIAILVFSSLFIIYNTTRLSMFARSTEISIMRMVGARKRFIRTVFLCEGLIIGIVGACISYLLLWFLYENFIIPNISALQFVELVKFSKNSSLLLVSFFVAGCGLGLGGSMIAISKHLKN